MPPPPPPSGQLWYVARGGQRFGPMLYNQLAHLFQFNQLFPGDFCWTEGMSAWIPVSQIFGIERMAALMPVSDFGGTTRSTEIPLSPVAAPNPVGEAVASPKPDKAAPLPSSAEIKKATRWCLIIGLLGLGGAAIVLIMVVNYLWEENIITIILFLSCIAKAAYSLGFYFIIKSKVEKISGYLGLFTFILLIESSLGIFGSFLQQSIGAFIGALIHICATYFIWEGRTSAKDLGR